MSAQKILIIAFVVCLGLTWVGSEVSTGDGSLGSYMYHVFRGLGAIAIAGWFVFWYFSPTDNKADLRMTAIGRRDYGGVWSRRVAALNLIAARYIGGFHYA